MTKTAVQMCAENAATAFVITSAQTRVNALVGSSDLQFTVQEARSKTRINATLTMKNENVNAQANTLDGATTIRSRKNGANGNLSVSIASSTTGQSQDTTDSDSLVNGDDSDWQMATGGTVGSIHVPEYSATFDHSANATVVLGANTSTNAQNVVPGVPQFSVVNGTDNFGGTEQTFTLRYPTTLSNMNARVDLNSVNAASTVNLRKNRAKANETISIPFITTGNFLDATDTDSLVSGDAVAFQAVPPTSGGGAVDFRKLQIQNQNTGDTESFTMLTGDTMGVLDSAPNTYWAPSSGGLDQNNIESRKQAKMPSSILMKNLFVKVPTGNNTTNTASTVSSRKNSANGNLSVSVPSSTTGQFEDLTTDRDETVSGDLVDYQTVPGGTSAQNLGVLMIASQWVFVSSSVATGGAYYQPSLETRSAPTLNRPRF